MNCRIVLTKSFKRSVKDLEKHYPRIKKDLTAAIEEIESKPEAGDVIPGSNGCRKLRVINSDSQRGKRGGYRLIYLLRTLSESRPQLVAYMLFMYAKAIKENITLRELTNLLESIDE